MIKRLSKFDVTGLSDQARTAPRRRAHKAIMPRLMGPCSAC
jgi:hypothetical protein